MTRVMLLVVSIKILLLFQCFFVDIRLNSMMMYTHVVYHIHELQRLTVCE